KGEVKLRGRDEILSYIQPKFSRISVRGKRRPDTSGSSALDRETANSRRDMVGYRFELLTLGKDYLGRFGAARRIATGESPRVDETLLKAILSPSQQAGGTCEVPRFCPGAFPSNPEQERLVCSIGENRITCAQGPPGTGKSTTIYHTVHAMQQAGRGEKNGAALITCVTNQAINAIMEKLHKCEGQGVRSLVLGNAERVGVDAKPYLLEEKVKRDYAVVASRKVREQFEQQYVRAKAAHETAERERLAGSGVLASLVSRGPRPFSLPTQTKKVLLADYKKLEDKLETDLREYEAEEYCGFAADRVVVLTGETSELEHILRRVDRLYDWAKKTAAKRIVLSTTCFLFTIASGYRMKQLQDEYDLPKITLGILDEAGATAESHTPLILETGVENLLLLGDTKQLRPLVKGDPPREYQIDRSLMERCGDAGADQQSLKEQYRMPPEICDLVSELFYQKQLRTGKNKQRLRGTKDAAGDPRLRWVEVSGAEAKVGTSFCNAAQTVVAVREAARKLKACANSSVYVICMYKPQVRLAQAVWRKAGLDELAGNRLQIVSVDACQGSEADHIILLTSRSNAEGTIGFCSNPNRCNVALSRAKESLTIVGNSKCMANRSTMWASVGKKCTKVAVCLQPAAGVEELVADELERMQGAGAARAGGKGRGKLRSR
ncbi:unnamed protein product, partial [Amoebophrya sp. A120]